ncbi:hypothetical protein MMC28_006621 [Mycoblastus sanguinarius]|nr:hypothetical protein [Mycoblastus sanguinarius]
MEGNAGSVSELEKAQIICVIGKRPNFQPSPYDHGSTHDISNDKLTRQTPGGPGVGKGTQCVWLAKELGVVHVSVGELLRAEGEKPVTQQKADFKAYFGAGTLVPHEVVQEILETHLLHNVKEGRTRFLVDGFPRSMQQTSLFEEDCKIKAVLHLHASKETMLERMLKRSKTSGRVDDNAETFKKRYQGFLDESTDVINDFQGRSSRPTADQTIPADPVQYYRVECERDLKEIYPEIRDLVKKDIFGIASA